MKLHVVLSAMALFVLTTAGVASAQYPGEYSMPRGWKDDPVAHMKGDFERGARNETVGQAQEKLRDLGYYAGPIDGVLGPAERSAIWRFQKAKGLPATASLDPATVSALGLTYASPGSSGLTNFGTR